MTAAICALEDCDKPAREGGRFCTRQHRQLDYVRRKRSASATPPAGLSTPQTPGEALGDRLSVDNAPTLGGQREKPLSSADFPPLSGPVVVKVRGKDRELGYVGVLHLGKVGRERGQHYAVSVCGIRVVDASTDAAFAACRVLDELGLHGGIGFRHDGDPMIGLVATIEAGAKLTASETKAHGPRLAKWMPFKRFETNGDDEDEDRDDNDDGDDDGDDE